MLPPSNNKLVLKIIFVVLFLALLGELGYVFMTINKKNIISFAVPTSTPSKKTYITNVSRPWPFDQTTTIKSLFIPKENIYLYTFLGTFTDINLDKRLIYLQGLDQKIYTFLIPNLIDYDKKGMKVTNVVVKQLNNTPNLFFTSFYKEKINGPTFSKTDFINIEWLDERTQDQLIKSFDKNPSIPLNFYTPSISSFTVLKN